MFELNVNLKLKLDLVDHAMVTAYDEETSCSTLFYTLKH